MKPEILMYSTDKNITFGDLKNLKSNEISISISDLQKTQDLFVKNHIQATMVGDESYHPKFQSIPTQPYIMHYIGDLSLLDKNILGIVGPRKPSDYSYQVLQQLFDCAKNFDFVTISGMAEGVDQLCHSFSVKYDIPTIAVLGGGIYHYLKGSQRHIIQSIVDHGGLVLSEYKIDFAPTKYSFPQRNRIVAALCDKLFLPEAGENSGSLITANFAYNLGKSVYVAPGNMFSPMEKGIFQLVNDHKASFLTNFSSFFIQNYIQKNTELGQKECKENLPEEENIILNVLSCKGQMSLTNIVQETSLDLDCIMMHMTLLEMNNYVYQNVPGVYTLR